MATKQEDIIHIQNQIIKEYEHTHTFLNSVMMDVIQTYKDKKDRTEAETKLMNFAWDTNDCLVDQPRIIEWKRLLESK